MMSNTINRDKLRGIVTDLQKLTGKKVTVTRVLMSKRDCYKAIYELMKLELNIDTKKENETLKRLNNTLNEVNCEVNQDREELRKKLLKCLVREELLKKDKKLLEESLSRVKKSFLTLKTSWLIVFISLCSSVAINIIYFFK